MRGARRVAQGRHPEADPRGPYPVGHVAGLARRSVVPLLARRAPVRPAASGRGDRRGTRTRRGNIDARRHRYERAFRLRALRLALLPGARRGLRLTPVSPVSTGRDAYRGRVPGNRRHRYRGKKYPKDSAEMRTLRRSPRAAARLDSASRIAPRRASEEGTMARRHGLITA